jgi:hypothetical protein
MKGFQINVAIRTGPTGTLNMVRFQMETGKIGANITGQGIVGTSTITTTRNAIQGILAFGGTQDELAGHGILIGGFRSF